MIGKTQCLTLKIKKLLNEMKWNLISPEKFKFLFPVPQVVHEELLWLSGYKKEHGLLIVRSLVQV